jgi:hypothetical protein
VAATEKLVRSPRVQQQRRRPAAPSEDGLRRPKTAGGGHSNLNLNFEIKLDLDP